ncbi:hypothetical protein [Candidatus Methanomassiliicoccus intestinalis]|jgi:hypothetical protein|uniref:Uncharacterized protein n=1 Tax=Siphoviridae sp. ctedO8 TaxID=2827907 RepID=A0A8S5T4J6_9CAUD|nr:MAG TPA: hypothetical protein [Siphoviridae sp. ctedO8]
MTILIRDISLTPQTVTAGSTYLISVDVVPLDYSYYAKNYTYKRMQNMTYKQISEGEK